MKSKGGWVVACAVVCFGCGVEFQEGVDAPVGEAEPLGEAAQPIMNGIEMDPLWGDLYVRGMVMVEREDGGFCSGSLINSHALITSAHCFKRDGKYGGTFRIYVSAMDTDGSIKCVQNSVDYLNEACTPMVANVHVHPNFDGSGDREDDIALVWVGYGWGAPADQQSFWLRLQKSAPKVGDRFMRYGWGLSTDTSGGGMPRFGTNVSTVDRLYARSFSSYFADPRHPRSCGGDSGGPLLRVREGLEPLIMGMHDSTPDKDGECPESDGISWSVRVDQKISWIDSIVPFSCKTYKTVSYEYVTCWNP